MSADTRDDDSYLTQGLLSSGSKEEIALGKLLNEEYNQAIDDAMGEVMKLHKKWLIPDTSNVNKTPYTELINQLQGLKKS